MKNLLNIIYEDNHLIVVVKPINVLSQPDITKDLDMMTLIKNYLKDRYQKPGNVYLGLVHRLDRMTSGLMVFSKTSKCSKRLNEQIKEKKWHKKYYALVEGNVNDSQTLESYLYKDEQLVKSCVVDQNHPQAKYAQLNFNVVWNNNQESLLDVELLTGRHHQIRVQLANINHPLVGDTLYGSKIKTTYKLHAYYLSFLHPITNERLEFINYPIWSRGEENE